MNQRHLGTSAVSVPAMGIGTQAWGDTRFGYGTAYGRENLFAVYTAALDAGLHFFDTSDTYGKGLSEELLGDFAQRDGRPIVVATKFTQAKIYDPNRNFTVAAVGKVLERSLQRLQREAVDLYQLHYPPARHRLHRYLDAMAHTVHSGRARAIGVSNFSTSQLRAAHHYLKSVHGIELASNQVAFNLLHRHPQRNGMLAACRELRVSLLPILPLAEGVLTGKYRVGGQAYGPQQATLFRGASLFEPGESFLAALRSTPYEMHREALEPLFVAMAEVAAAHEATIAQVALNWLVTVDELVIPIPGAKNPAQATSNAAALGWTMSAQEHQHLSSVEESVRHSLQHSARR